MNRIIQAICEHVVADYALTGGSKCVGIEESAHLGVVITALEVIEPSIVIVDVTTVAKRVHICVGAGGLKDVAEGIIFVVSGSVSVDIHQPDYVTLQVRNVVVNYIVVVGRVTVAHGNRDTIDVIGEVQNVVPVGHADKLRAVVIVAVHHTIDGLAGANIKSSALLSKNPGVIALSAKGR
jgi:hypothetical protein